MNNQQPLLTVNGLPDVNDKGSRGAIWEKDMREYDKYPNGLDNIAIEK